MTDFSDVINFLAEIGATSDQANQPTPLKQDEIDQLRKKYGEIPKDFLDYLSIVGAGSVNDCRYMIYGGLLSPSEYFDPEDIEELENHILCFGDDFAGNPAGFLPKNNWRIAEIWHEDLTLNEVDLTFGQFIRQKIGMMDNLQ